MSEKHKKQAVRSFIGKYADDLGQLISIQIKPVYQSVGIVVPVKSCSIIHALAYLQQASLMDLAKFLNQSHQLVKQKLPRLLKLNLLLKSHDPNDKRRTLYTLSTLGQQQAELLQQNPLEQVYQQLSLEVGADIYAVLSAAMEGLKNKDLLTRFQELNQTKL